MNNSYVFIMFESISLLFQQVWNFFMELFVGFLAMFGLNDLKSGGNMELNHEPESSVPFNNPVSHDD